MKTLKNSSGFSVVHVLLVLVVLGIVGFMGWFVWNANKSTPATQSKSKTVVNKDKYVVPSGYGIYKANGVRFAYPKQWKESASEEFVTVTRDSDAVIHQGCGDEACALRYDPASKNWKNTTATSGTKVVAESGAVQAYLIPVHGEMNCGTWAAMVHTGDKFAQVTLSICTKPQTKDEFQPSGNQLLYDDVVSQLKEVVKSVNKV